MSNHNRPAFLDALIPDAILTGTLLRGSIVGRDSITKVVETVGTFYESMTPTFHEAIRSREILEYEAVLSHGRILQGLIVITKNSDGAVTKLTVNQGPIESVVWLSKEMGKLLSGELGADVFL